MIINIRGTSGAGKTVLIYEFFKWCSEITPIRNPKGVIKLYQCVYGDSLVYVLGEYPKGQTIGGCDRIQTQHEVRVLIDEYCKHGNVLFEGLMITHIYGWYAEKAKTMPREYLFLMLDAPFDECIDNIRKRRVIQGRPTELKDTVFKNAGKTYNAALRIRKKIIEDKLLMEILPMESRIERFRHILDFYLEKTI